MARDGLWARRKPWDIRGRTLMTPWRPGCSARSTVPVPRTLLRRRRRRALAVPHFQVKMPNACGLRSRPLRLLPRMLQAPSSLLPTSTARQNATLSRAAGFHTSRGILKVLALSDYAQTERSTFTDRGLSVARFPPRPSLGRRRRRATVRGVASFEAPALRQLGLRNCSGDLYRNSWERPASRAWRSLQPRAARPKGRPTEEQRTGAAPSDFFGVAGRLRSSICGVVPVFAALAWGHLSRGASSWSAIKQARLSTPRRTSQPDMISQLSISAVSSTRGSRRN